jgi:uncharacterized membrane protein YfcA
MDLTVAHFLIFVLWGGLIGFLAGFFGIGGGGFVVPLLILSYGHMGVSPSVLTHIGIATSLLVVFFASLMSAYQQNKEHNIHWRTSILVGFSSALTAVAAVKLAVFLNGRYLRIAFALMSMMLAAKIFTETASRDEKRGESTLHAHPAHLAGIGFTAGAVSGLAGVGGGGITIPMMYYFLKMPMKLAIGTSSAAMVITALFGAGSYIINGIGHRDLPGWCLGFIDIHRGIALVIGSLFTARIGAYVSFRTRPYLLRKLFALFLTFVSIYIIFVR